MHRNFTEEFHGFAIFNQPKPKPQNLVTRNITNKMHQNAPRKWTSQCTHFDAFCDFYLCIAKNEPEDWRVPKMWFQSLHPASTMVSFLVCLTWADFQIQTARWIISRRWLLHHWYGASIWAGSTCFEACRCACRVGRKNSKLRWPSSEKTHKN